MDAAIGFLVLVVVIIAGLCVLITGLVVGIYFLNRRVTIPAVFGNATRGEPIIDDWANEQGLEILKCKRIRDRDHPFADRFGFGIGKLPGAVYRVKARNRKGRERTGWVYMRMGLYGVLQADTLEVIWDE